MSEAALEWYMLIVAGVLLVVGYLGWESFLRYVDEEMLASEKRALERHKVTHEDLTEI